MRSAGIDLVRRASSLLLLLLAAAPAAQGQARAYVANGSSNNASVIDTSTNTVIATVTVGSSPISLGDFVGPGPVPVELQSFAIE